MNDRISVINHDYQSGVYINGLWKAKIFSLTMDFPIMAENFPKISKFAID